MSKRSIVLIGFMGVGKTTLGKELARHLQKGFIDIDNEIEDFFQMKAVDIFKKYGEAAFRKKEKDLIIEACKEKGKVISVGGGAFKQDKVRDYCLKHATVLFLEIRWDAWKERIELLTPTRPLLQGKTMEDIKDLFNERQAMYADHHVRVVIDDLSVHQAVEEIVSELKLYQ